MARSRTRSGSSSSSGSTSTVEARVLVDTYRWHDDFGDTDSPVNEAGRGDTISVSADEYERGRAMTPPALARASDRDARPVGERVTMPDDLSELSDKELRDLAARLGLDVGEDPSRDELMGAVSGAPGYERPTV